MTLRYVIHLVELRAVVATSLSNFAYNFHLRRFHSVGQFKTKLSGHTELVKRMSTIAPLSKSPDAVWRCRLKPVDTCVDFACFQRLTLSYDEPLSKLCFQFQLAALKGGEAPALHRDQVPARPPGHGAQHGDQVRGPG